MRTFLKAKAEVKDEDVKMENEDGDDEVFSVRMLELKKIGWQLPRAPEKIVLRACFDSLKQLIAQSVKRAQSVLLVGTGGTGKSLFIIWLLHELYQKVPVDMIVDIEGMFLRIKSNGDIEGGTRGVSFADELGKKETLYFFDSRDGAPKPLAVNALVIASTSPSRKEMQKWKSDFSPAQLIMPLWSKDELVACRLHCYPTVSWLCVLPFTFDAQVKEEDFELLYEHWGGTVRRTLSDLVFGCRLCCCLHSLNIL